LVFYSSTKKGALKFLCFFRYSYYC